MTAVTPRPAAALILLREAAAGFEVLMVTRHPDSGFAAGAMVFPGGKLEAGEDFAAAALRETFEETGLKLPDEARLVPFAHWITPLDRPKRFDTRFFIADAPAVALAERDQRETIDLCWIRPADALADNDRGPRSLNFATYLNLNRLAAHRTAAEAVAAAARSAIVTVCPRPIETADGLMLTIPADAGYAITRLPGDQVRLA